MYSVQYTDLAYTVLVQCELSVFVEWERHSVTFMMILSAMTMIIMMILSALAMIIMINGDTIRDDNYFIEASDYNYDYDEYDEDTISEDNDHDNQS